MDVEINANGNTGHIDRGSNNASRHEWHGNGWFIDDVAKSFNEGAILMSKQLDNARKELSEKPDDPSVLADFQAKLSEYTLFRNAQSSTVKAFKDIGAAIVQNFR